MMLKSECQSAGDRAPTSSDFHPREILMMRNEVSHTAGPNQLIPANASTTPESQTHSSLKDGIIRLGHAPTEKSWRGILASVALVGLITILGLRTEPIVGGTNLAILYMLSVMVSAFRWGQWAAVVSAVSSAVLLNYLFVPPYRTFVVADLWYSITLIGLLAIGLVVSMLTLAAQDKARAASRREAHTEALYALTKSIADGTLDQILGTVEHHVFETFRRRIVILAPDAAGLTVRFKSADLVFDEHEEIAASWVFETGEKAGRGTGKFSDSRIRYVPLKVWREGIVGVGGLQAGGLKELLPPDQEKLLVSFLSQAVLAITRADLLKKAQHNEVLQETDKLQKAILNSISHNLRTPITTVVGALNSVLYDGALQDASLQRKLLETAQDEAMRLNRLVQNLLDMSRLEGGAIRVKAELCDVQDLVGAALEQLGEPGLKRSISVTIAPDVPHVPMDQVMIVQVLVNLLDNALKYSPVGTQIEIGARADDGKLEIRVADLGKGIPEQDLERVFEKFFRNAATGSPRGTGLGLSICKGLVEAHNGRIWARRRPQGGAEVTFFLPLEVER